jgi:hypothetical protein
VPLVRAQIEKRRAEEKASISLRGCIDNHVHGVHRNVDGEGYSDEASGVFSEHVLGNWRKCHSCHSVQGNGLSCTCVLMYCRK